MTRPGDPTPDCHFYPKAAVRDDGDAPATGFFVVDQPPLPFRDCHFARDPGRSEPLPAIGAADGDTQQKHTFGRSAANASTGDTAWLHTSKAGSRTVGTDAAERAPSAAVSPAGALDAAGAAIAASAVTC